MKMPAGPVWLELCDAADEAMEEERVDDAVGLLNEALRLNPHAIEALEKLAETLYNRKDYEAAFVCTRRVAALTPDSKHTYNLALNYRSLLRFKESRKQMENALSMAQKNHKISYKLAIVCMDLGDFQGSRKAFEYTLRLDPRDPHSFFDLAFSHMVLGNYRTGLKIFENRKALSEKKGKELCVEVGERWRGDLIPGSSLLVCWEQGTGDMLQMLRYCTQASERCGTLVVQVPLDAEELVASIPGVDVTTAEKKPKGYDYFVPGCSLPHVLGIDPLKDSPGTPYFHVSEKRIAKARKQLSHISRDRPLVGLVWSGKPTFDRDQYRSILFKDYLDVLDFPDVNFVNLQYGPRAEDLRDSGIQGLVFDPTPGIKDFADTAALIMNLDLVVTCDTSVCHLTGALGKPVWILVEWRADWRWTLGHEEPPPWYPSAKIFRQGKARPSDWRVPVERMRTRFREVFGVSKIFSSGAMEKRPLPTSKKAKETWAKSRAAGLLAKREGNLEDALTELNRALAISPDDVDVLEALGDIHYEEGLRDKEEGGLPKALICRRRASLLAPSAERMLRLGRVMETREAYNDAWKTYKAGNLRDPEDSRLHTRMGAVRLKKARPQEARAHFLEALELNPKEAEAEMGLAHLDFMEGKYGPGWKRYRQACTLLLPAKGKRFGRPLWEGGSLSGSLLVDGRDAPGELLLALSRAPLQRQSESKLFVLAREGFEELAARLPGVDKALCDPEGLEFDYWSSPELLLAACAASPLSDAVCKGEDFVASEALGAIDEALKQGRSRKLRIGLAWAGEKPAADSAGALNALVLKDAKAGFPLESGFPSEAGFPLKDLLLSVAIPELSFFNLQLGESASEVKAESMEGMICDLGVGRADYKDLAALIWRMDLVVSYDNAVAHLAAALGKPLWVIAEDGSFWWLSGKDGKSLWHPQARVLSRGPRGKWREVALQLEAGLIEYVDRKDRGL